MVYSRRTMLKQLGLAACLGTMTPRNGHSETLAAPLAFGYSLYGMKSVPLAKALKACADIGYSGVELACMKDWPCDPGVLPRGDRVQLRKLLTDHALDLPCLMDNLVLVVPELPHGSNLSRLKRLADLAHDLGGDSPPIIETVLGGKPEQWPDIRQQMAEALADWAKVAAEAKVVIAIKPHAFGALHRPEDCVWLLNQVRSPSIKAVFDYSHYERQGLPLKECVQTLIGESVFVHIKDNVKVEDRTEFALPGDGETDYAAYLRLLRESGYRGPVVVEVSAQVSNKPGYNPLLAAERCYEKLRPAFEQAGARARG